MALTVLELCAGGGGQALGLEMAGFETAAAAEIDPYGCTTLRLNRPNWEVLECDVKELRGHDYAGVDLVAGGVPCPPFSVAGRQLGEQDERDLFPEALRIVREARPRAVMLENVQGFSSAKFSDYRSWIRNELQAMGYEFTGRLLNASNFDVPQLRPRFVIVGVRKDSAESFHWPDEVPTTKTVGGVLADLMSKNGWPGSIPWSLRANDIAPTIVGGSKKHGGPDLGPTRAKRQWAKLGVDGLGIANEAPDASYPIDKMPKLTVRMVARLQGFPDNWEFSGRKTASYRQVGNAFPPPVAQAVGFSIQRALTGVDGVRYRQEPNGQLAFVEEAN